MTITIEGELELIKRKGQPAPAIVAPAPEAAAATAATVLREPPSPALAAAMADLSETFQAAVKPVQDTALPPGEEEPPWEPTEPVAVGDAGFVDTWASAWKRDTITTDAWGYADGKRRNLVMDMYRTLPPEAQARATSSQRNYTSDWRTFEQMVMDEAGKFVATDPTKWGDLPLTQDQFDQRLKSEDQAILADAEAVLAQPGGGLTEFFASMARSLTKPESLALLPFGGAAGGAGKFILSEMLLSGAASVAALPGQYDAADRLDLPDPDATTQVATEMAFGGLFAGGILGIGKGINWAMGRERTAIEALPEGESPVTFGAAVDREEAAMTGDRTVQEATKPAGSVTGLPPIASDAPAGWEQIRNGIFAGESGGDYEALFGYQNRPGGVFENVRLTKMTVDEAIAFSTPRGEYGQWVNAKIGRVATPMGAYQIVGTTLRAAKAGLKLSGRERMTPALQDKLGIWIYQRQGTGAWEGYAGPRADFRPASGDVPSFSSRGYTGSGQISDGDGTRVDVDYEVVDYSSLIRASGDLQPRDRTRINSDEQIASMAARLDPAQLMPSPNAAMGTPIIGPDNIIESGNGRAMAIARAYEQVPDRAAAYRGAIEAAGYNIPEGVERPVLIARRKSPLDDAARRRFVVAAQDAGTAQMTPIEVARATARNLQSPILSRLDPTQPIASAANGDFVRAALATLPQTARNAMFDATGALNANGQRQLREALFARAWPDPDILARYTEGASPELKSLLEALETAAPNWAALRADIEAGLVSPDMDISPYVLDAMRLIGNARDLSAKQGLSIGKALTELLDQVDMLDGAISPLTAALVRKFWSNGRASPADQVATFLARYADEARNAGKSGGMFDAPTPRDVLRTVDLAGFADLPEELGRARGFAIPTAPQASMAEDAFTEGAASPEVDAVHLEIEAGLRAGEETSAQIAPLTDALKDANPQTFVQTLAAEQPFDTIEELYARAAIAQDRLAAEAETIAADLGVTWKNPGLKDRATADTKIARKRYASAKSLTDVSRGAFVIDDIAGADAVVDRLAAKFDLIDEGWVRTDEGYFDRKVVIRHPDGMLSEVQILTSNMAVAKKQGHALYQQRRSLPENSPERNTLIAQEKAVYSAAAAGTNDSAFSAVGTSKVPKLRAQPDFKSPADDTTAAVWDTSSASTGSQSLSRDSLARANNPPEGVSNSTAGRPSQFENDRSFMGEVPSVDTLNVGADAGLVNSADPILDQAALDNFAAQSAIIAARNQGAAFKIEMTDGTTYSAAEVLDDIARDADTDFQITFCTTNDTSISGSAV